MAKYQKGAVSWAMYDWANSAWATTVLAGFYPVFFTKYWAADLPGYDKVAYLGYANSAAALCVFLLAAVVGAIADKGNRKKKMIAGFAGMGIVLTGCLFWVARGEWFLAAVIYSFSYVFWLFANISYDSLIVSVSDDHDVDRISSLGYSLGYLGGGLLFTLNVFMFSSPQTFGLVDKNIATLSGDLESYSLVKSADLKEAVLSYNADTESDDYDTNFQRATVLEASGDLDAAVLAYHKLQLSLQPDMESYYIKDANLESILARILEQNNQIDASQKRHLEVIEKTKKIKGKRGVHLNAHAYEHNAAFLARQGNLGDAIKNYTIALDTRQKVLGKNAKWDEKIIPALKGRSDVYITQKAFDKALADLSHVWAIRIGKKGENKENPHNAFSLYEHADLLVAQSKFSEAEAKLQEAYKMLSEAFDPEHKFPTEARNKLAVFYASQGRYKEARALAMESWNFKKEDYGDDHKIEEDPSASVVLEILYGIETGDRAIDEAAVYAGDLKKIKSVWVPVQPGPAEQITDTFGLAAAMAVKWSFLSVAVWWALFSLPLLLGVKDQHVTDSVPLGTAIKQGIQEVVGTFHEIRKLKVVLMFLLAYWFYIDGVDTIIAMAVGYGSSIGIGTGALIGSLLLVQFVAIPFALLFGWGGQRHGPKTWILIGIGIYISITFYAALYLDTKTIFGLPKFLYLAIMIGMAQGGVQALSRSYFSRIIPEDRSAEFFGFYNMIGKFAAFVGPALMGFVGVLAQDQRMGIMAIVILFLIGGTLLLFVDTKKGEKLAKELNVE